MRVTNYTAIYTAVKNSNLAKPKKHAQKQTKTSTIEYNKSEQKLVDYTYINPKQKKISKSNIEKMQQEQRLKMRHGFMKMAQEIVLDQAMGYRQALQQLLHKNKISKNNIEQAKLNIAEEGYWGVTKTATRIITFANSLTNDNPQLAKELQVGFIKGFEAAEKAWGGQLPQICYETKNMVLNEFESLLTN
ncbi:hypothetical protein IMX26_11735 [Clostridium sp. 'deep sea']|uniref:hypothetical protein n=1 Tax=Clostridium sp. 'deep sea' TaxID=2779445 RepID=UPI00189669FD|nr:hypothetical protein [Clostridium sp. 'deep sea']QOR34158.1 hypothetical protein IMX26_11735 [Clostridium sp. 'deep sea']